MKIATRNRPSAPLKRRLGAQAVAAALCATSALAVPKVVIMSLDGATPRLVDQYSASGALLPNQGLRLLEGQGVKAARNTTIFPSLTAPAHIAIATGAPAASNDVIANGFRLLASPFNAGTISGFGAPIGGYLIDGPAETPNPTAEPLWIALRNAGRVVATATWPGGDGIDVRVPGPNTIVQPAIERTVDYTIPFGAATAPFQKGFNLTAANFSVAPQTTVDQLSAAGRTSFSTVRQMTLETFTSGGAMYDIRLAALDSTNDSTVNYDTLVFFNQAQGIQPGPFALPSTGPAYIQPSTKISALFYLEGHANKGGTRYFATQLAPDLSSVRVARTSIAFLPRSNSASVPQVLADVDDINNNVGFWQPQPDFRIVERIDATPSTFAAFPDLELEAIYMELVREFVTYQTNVGLRAMTRFPDADLVMIYIEQPDGAGHQFLLTDSRQPTDFTNPASIGAGQDLVKKARYNSYLQEAYFAANNAVQRVVNAVGQDGNGRPNSNVFVVSDHGFDPFHTAVTLNALLTEAGIDLTNVRVTTSGPAANIYINLQGRQQPSGTQQTRQQFLDLQQRIATALRNYADTNPNYTLGAGSVPIFDQVLVRPIPADINDPSFGRRTNEKVAQDSGDVSAVLKVGYNFDGRQNPVITRMGDSSNTVLSVPNFYGAHGHDPEIEHMSAIFYAAGPDILPGTLASVSNIDVAPTIMRILGVTPAATVQGRALQLGSAEMKLQRAVSRKIHGSAGARDLVLPLMGLPGIESRNAASGNAHQLVFQFSNNPTGGTAAVTSGAGSVSGVPVFSGNEMRVNLTGVTDIQTLTVTLSNVTDSLGGSVPSAVVNAAFLRGDINADRTVNPTDVAEAKSLGYASAPISNVNFRGDATVNGAMNSSDVAFTKANLGHTLPQPLDRQR